MIRDPGGRCRPDNAFPQAGPMSDESMVRNLAAQAHAIWPQESRLFERYELPRRARVLDVGCGTGEIASRLARLLPDATVLGVDILESHLDLARSRHADLAPRVAFERADAYDLPFPDASFDLVTCRHVSQSIPDFHLVVESVRRVLAPGGWLHLLSEDYLMLHFPARGTRYDPDDLWRDVVLPYLDETGTDGRVGRHSHALLRSAGFRDVSVDYVVVDSLRCGNAALVRILEAWRDGYATPDALARRRSPEEIRARFDSLIESLAEPDAYAAWHVPVIAGRK